MSGAPRPDAAGATPAEGAVDEPAARDDLLEEAERLLAELGRHPDGQVRAKVDRLLETVDTVHRLGLTRLVGAIHGMAGEAFIHRLCGDPAVRLLLMSYDLVAVDRRILAEEALDPVRAHLHGHGVDVELVEVVGSVVYVRLHPPQTDSDFVGAVARDLEEALRDGLPGFQELEIGERRPRGSGLVQMGEYRPARKPVHRRVADADEVEPGRLHAAEVDGVPLLLARVDGEVHAVRDRCGDSPLPLSFGRVEGSVLTCSWHGCRYDLRTGRRVDGGTDRLDVFPVRTRDGVVEVALATEPAEAEADG